MKPKLNSTKFKRQADLQEEIEQLKKKDALHEAWYERFQEMDFPEEVRVHIYGFTPLINVLPLDQEYQDFHAVLAACVRNFGCKFKRHFSEYTGTFSWIGRLDGIAQIEVYRAPANGCRIVSTQEVTTKFKSICPDGTQHEIGADAKVSG